MVVGRLSDGTIRQADRGRVEDDSRESASAASQTLTRSARSAPTASPKASAIPASGPFHRCLAGRRAACSCWWPAPTSPTCCLRATPSASASSRCAWRWAPAAAASRGSCSSRACCWLARRDSCGAAGLGRARRHAVGVSGRHRPLRAADGSTCASDAAHVSGYRGAGRRRAVLLFAHRPACAPARQNVTAGLRSAARLTSGRRPSARPRMTAGRRADRAHAGAAGRARACRCRRSTASRKARSASIPTASLVGRRHAARASAIGIPNRAGSSSIACSPASTPFPPSTRPASPACSPTPATRTRRPASGARTMQPRPADAVDVGRTASHAGLVRRARCPAAGRAHDRSARIGTTAPPVARREPVARTPRSGRDSPPSASDSASAPTARSSPSSASSATSRSTGSST